MASQPRIIAGGKAMAAYGAAVKFIVGPAITAATAVAVGLRGNLLRITIVQVILVAPFSIMFLFDFVHILIHYFKLIYRACFKILKLKEKH